MIFSAWGLSNNHCFVICGFTSKTSNSGGVNRSKLTLELQNAILLEPSWFSGMLLYNAIAVTCTLQFIRICHWKNNFKWNHYDVKRINWVSVNIRSHVTNDLPYQMLVVYGCEENVSNRLVCVIKFRVDQSFKLKWFALPNVSRVWKWRKCLQLISLRHKFS